MRAHRSRDRGKSTRCANGTRVQVHHDVQGAVEGLVLFRGARRLVERGLVPEEPFDVRTLRQRAAQKSRALSGGVGIPGQQPAVREPSDLSFAVADQLD